MKRTKFAAALAVLTLLTTPDRVWTGEGGGRGA